LQTLPFAWGHPDLVFVLVVFIAYRFAWLPGLALVFCAAWLFEATVSLRLGIYAIQCLVIFVFLKTVTHNISIRESIYQTPLAVLAFVLFRLLSFFLASMTGEDLKAGWSWWPLLRDTLWFAVMTWSLFKVFDVLLSSVARFSWRRQPMAKSSKIAKNAKSSNGRRNP